MGDAKWVKFEVNMFDDTKLKIIDSMNERDSIQYIWTRLLVLAGKINRGGHLYITDNMAYTIKTFAIEFNRSIDEVKTALKVLKRLEMVELTEDKAFKIKNWEKHQNIEGLERLRNQNNQRVAKHRAKKKETKGNNEEEEINALPEIYEFNKQIRNNYKGANDKFNQIEEYIGNTSDFTEDVFNDKDNIIYNINKNQEIKAKECIDCSDKSIIVLDQTNTNANSDINTNDNFNLTRSYDSFNFTHDYNNCNVTNDYDNSSCNITVIEQNKKEIKTKMEIKKESKSDIEDVIKEDFNNISKKDCMDDSKKIENLENEIINSQVAAKLLNHHQNMTGIIGGLNLGSLKLAISVHGYENVKMAINKALEVNKSDMTYINGILKNWRREGYPSERDEKKNGPRSIRKNNSADKNEFTGFKAKRPRKLSETERNAAEEGLL